MFNHRVATAPVVYRLAPTVVARLVGLALVGLALLLFVGTAVVALAGLPADLLVARGAPGRGRPASASAGGCAAAAWVVRCTDDGYRVRLVRGAGVTRGALERGRGRGHHRTAATSPAWSCGCGTVGRRRSRSGVLAVDREEFVRELQARLQRGHGLRPL